MKLLTILLISSSLFFTTLTFAQLEQRPIRVFWYMPEPRLSIAFCNKLRVEIPKRCSELENQTNFSQVESPAILLVEHFYPSRILLPSTVAAALAGTTERNIAYNPIVFIVNKKNKLDDLTENTISDFIKGKSPLPQEAYVGIDRRNAGSQNNSTRVLIELQNLYQTEQDQKTGAKKIETDGELFKTLQNEEQGIGILFYSHLPRNLKNFDLKILTINGKSYEDIHYPYQRVVSAYMEQTNTETVKYFNETANVLRDLSAGFFLQFYPQKKGALNLIP